jgi:hypothetical protein
MQIRGLVPRGGDAHGQAVGILETVTDAMAEGASPVSREPRPAPLPQAQDREENHQGKIPSADVEPHICNGAGALGHKPLVKLIRRPHDHGENQRPARGAILQRPTLQ